MRNKSILLILFVFIFSAQVLATPKPLEFLHNIELNQCLRIEGCDQIKIKRCRALLDNEGFPGCDAEFHKNPKSSDNWAACIAKFRTKHMSGREFGFMMNGSTCKEPLKKTATHAKGMPKAAPLARYFTAMSLDINKPRLHLNPEGACGAGARKTEDYTSKINRDIKLNIKVSGHKKTNGVIGNGHIGYSLMLKKTVHKYGKCYGKKVATYLRNKGGHKKGDQIKNDYGDVLYVAVDCESSPKPAVCD